MIIWLRFACFKRCFVQCCLWSLLLYAQTTLASPLQGKARILDKKGVPCFTVEHGSSRLDFITVSEISPETKDSRTESVNAVLDQTGRTIEPLMDSSSCVLYGSLYERYEHNLLKELGVGKVYEVWFSANEDTLFGSVNRSYTGFFCITATENGGMKVHQLAWKNHQLQVDICKPFNTTIPKPAPPPVIYHAKIYDRHGVPCFRPQNDDKRAYELSSISVYRGLTLELPDKNVMRDKETVMWKMYFLAGYEGKTRDNFFDSTKCLSYGTSIQEKMVSTSKLKSLEPNQFYTVELRLALINPSRPGGDGVGTGVEDRVYESYFCLARTKEGKTKVHEVPYNKKKRNWDFNICEQSIKNKSAETNKDNKI